MRGFDNRQPVPRVVPIHNELVDAGIPHVVQADQLFTSTLNGKTETVDLSGAIFKIEVRDYPWAGVPHAREVALLVEKPEEHVRRLTIDLDRASIGESRLPLSEKLIRLLRLSLIELPQPW